jgi:hypothetical protein
MVSATECGLTFVITPSASCAFVSGISNHSGDGNMGIGTYRDQYAPFRLSP